MMRTPRSSTNTIAALVSRTRTGTDDYGKPVYTETYTLLQGVYWPAGSSETVLGQDQVVWQDTLCLPTGTDVTAVDAVIAQVTLDAAGNPVLDGNGHPQGEQFEVDGEPAVWPANPFADSPQQHPFAVVLQLKRVAG